MTELQNKQVGVSDEQFAMCEWAREKERERERSLFWTACAKLKGYWNEVIRWGYNYQLKWTERVVSDRFQFKVLECRHLPEETITLSIRKIPSVKVIAPFRHPEQTSIDSYCNNTERKIVQLFSHAFLLFWNCTRFCHSSLSVILSLQFLQMSIYKD